MLVLGSCRIQYIWIYAAVILAGVAMVISEGPAQCRLDNGQCVYRVELVEGHCGGNNLPGSEETNPVQSDSNKIVDIEKTLQNVKAEHSKMISELQNKIDQLSNGFTSNGGQGNTINTLPQPQGFKAEKIQATGRDTGVLKASGSEGDAFRTNAIAEQVGDLGIPLNPNRTENSLLNELHEKFTMLRLELQETKRRLRDTEKQLRLSRSQLNKTEETLKVTNEALKKSEENILEAENKRKEMSKLLVKKDKEANVIKNKLKHCRKQIKSKDLQIWELGSDVEKLRKQLEDCQEELQQTKLLLERALIKYHDLNIRHENVSQELNKTKEELTQQKARERVTSFCGFEDPDICGYEKDNSTLLLEWIQWSMATPSHWTGPEGDHTCGNGQGHYMYVEATAQANDRKARLISPQHGGDQEQCVEFYYHMYGRNIGILNVILIMKNRTYEEFPPPVWRAYGNQGNVWTMARLPVPRDVAMKGYQVVFEAFTAAGYAGDIAIDDIRVFIGECFGSESLSQWRAKHRNHMLDTLRDG